jgi:RNA polymerase sigma-70 factor (ECF subfamily)
MAETLSAEVVDVLVERHRQFLQFLESRAGSRAAAEELLQAAFVKALERGAELRDAESAVAWFYRLLRNALIDFYRHRGAERRTLDRQAAEAPLFAEAAPELEAAICECIHGLIPTLKKEYTALLRAVEIEGRSVTDVARDLGITPGNAAVRLHRGRQALKARLEAACGTCTEHGCLDCTCKDKPPKLR